MGIKSFTSSIITVAFVIVGCGKSATAPAASGGSSNQIAILPALSTPVARIHWLGKERIGENLNATRLASVLAMPETARLRNQTLDKLSRAPWTLLRQGPDTNAASALLRRLLDDVAQKECYFEMRQVTNRPAESVFAIRLDDAQARLWNTNLATILESLTDIRVVPAAKGDGWSLKKHDPPNFIELTRAGGWTLIGAGQDRNSLLAATASRLSNNQVSPAIWSTNYWFEVEVDPRQIAGALPPWAWPSSWKVPESWPIFAISVIPDAGDVRTDCQLDFPDPLRPVLPAWNIPVQLIDQSLSSFTAVRGIGKAIGSLGLWKDWQLGVPPEQGCSWALHGLQMQTYFAVPSTDASNTVSRIADAVITKGEPWFASHDLARFVRTEPYPGMEWRGLPYMWPFLRSLETTNGSFIFGGYFSHSPGNPLSPDLLKEPLSATNLVCHDWEATGLRAEQWIYIAQFIRLVSKKAQLPFECASLAWIKAIGPKLGNSVTQVKVTGERQLSIVRKSSVGFTGVELQLLADWLESPQFPRGIHTLLAPPPAPL